MSWGVGDPNPEGFDWATETTESPLKVLHVDDDDAYREAVASAFDDLSLETAGSVAETRSVLDGEEFDCIVLDHGLPDGTGIELLREEAFGETPVVLLTGQGDETLAAEAIRAGVTEYYPKGEGADGIKRVAEAARRHASEYRREREVARLRRRCELVADVVADAVFEWRVDDDEATIHGDDPFGYDAAGEVFEVGWWRERVLADRWVYCFTPDGGDEPDGYVVSTLDRDGKVMQIEELIYRTETARRQLLAFVGRHVPQADRVEWTCPEERRLLFEAADPDAVDLSTVPGASGRIVDVIEAIKALPPDRAPTDPVTVAVSDPLRSANDGVFRVDTALTCTRVETGDADIGEAVDPDLTVDVAVLSQLYVGSVSIRTAADRERLDATDDAVAALSSTFGTRDVSVTDFF